MTSRRLPGLSPYLPLDRSSSDMHNKTACTKLGRIPVQQAMLSLDTSGLYLPYSIINSSPGRTRKHHRIKIDRGGSPIADPGSK